MPTVLTHVTVSTTDFAASLRFYDAALTAIGLDRVAEFGDEEEDNAPVEAASWGSGADTVLWLVSGASTRGAHLAFGVEERRLVDRFHGDAVAAGGTSRGAPRRWAIYRRGRYGAIVADPAGNLVEVTAPE